MRKKCHQKLEGEGGDRLPNNFMFRNKTIITFYNISVHQLPGQVKRLTKHSW